MCLLRLARTSDAQSPWIDCMQADQARATIDLQPGPMHGVVEVISRSMIRKTVPLIPLKR